MSTTQGQGWSLEEEVLHLRREVQNQQRRIAALLALVPPSRLVESNNSEESLWLFGYGSLIWNPGSIPFVRKVPAFVQGWKREFRQKSTDHRGTIDAPGRVVTLVPEPDAVCEGMAYEVPCQRGGGNVEISGLSRERQLRCVSFELVRTC
jgi:cation transport regulator ChaC